MGKKITITAVKADIGSIGGHIIPSKEVVSRVHNYINESGSATLIDSRISYTGDDILILLSHQLGIDNEQVHKLVDEAFRKGTIIAKEQGLYGAGQDLLTDAFSGNVKGAGPGIAEMEFDERPNEPFLVFAADKTDPGAYNLPLFLAFADPMHCSGLLLSKNLQKGFTFDIIDVNYAECKKCSKFHFTDQRCEDAPEDNKPGDRIIKLNAPEDYYRIAALLRDGERFVIKSIYSRHDRSQAAAVSTTRLHNIAGKYTGKDDPCAVVRVQSSFPATGEVLSPFAIGHYVAGFMRGSHNGPLMPVKQNEVISFFDGPPIVSCAAYCVHGGKFTDAADAFDQPLWDRVRDRISDKAVDIRRQGFFGPAMLPMSELEYGGIVDILAELDSKFVIE